MESKERIAARIIILKEYYNEKTKNIENLQQFYGEWYEFNDKELDVYLYSESYTNKEKTQKDITYYYKSPQFGTKLIPRKHCKIVYEFL